MGVGRPTLLEAFSIALVYVPSSKLQEYNPSQACWSCLSLASIRHCDENFNKERTKIDDVKHLASPILCNTCKDHSICTSRHAYDRWKMCMVMLDEFDADFLLFPQFQMSIDRCSYNKVCSVLLFRRQSTTLQWRVAYRVTVTVLIGSLCIKLL